MTLLKGQGQSCLLRHSMMIPRPSWKHKRWLMKRSRYLAWTQVSLSFVCSKEESTHEQQQQQQKEISHNWSSWLSGRHRGKRSRHRTGAARAADDWECQDSALPTRDRKYQWPYFARWRKHCAEHAYRHSAVTPCFEKAYLRRSACAWHMCWHDYAVQESL